MTDRVIVGLPAIYRSFNGYDCDAEIIADHRNGLVDVNVRVPGGLVLPKIPLRASVAELGRMQAMLASDYAGPNAHGGDK